MGLDILVRDRRGHEVYAERIGSYTNFHDFRIAWAKILGFDLEQMEGFGGFQPWKDEPLEPFFNHSDCDGVISWQDAEAILWQAKKDAPHLPQFARHFHVLIAACEAAIEQQTPIIFC